MKKLKNKISKAVEAKGKVSNVIARRQEDDSEDVYLVALDIGTEYVKVVTAEYDGDELKIIGTGRAKQQPDAMTAGAVSDIAKVVDACDAALVQAENLSGVSPRHAVIGVAGELVKGRANTVTYKRPEPEEEITDEEFESIIGEIQNSAYIKAKNELTWETGTDDIDIKIVNSAVVSIEIDGYKVANPVGFQGKDVKVHVYNAFAPLVHVGALEKIANELDLELVTIAAEPYAVARAVLGPNSDSEIDAVFVDVGGGTTDVALVNEGGIDGTVMFSVGGRSFTRSIANKTGLNFERAENVKLKYSLEPSKYKNDKAELVRESLGSTIELWLQGLAIALEDLSNGDNIPSNIMFCGGGSSIKQLRQAVQGKEWRSDLQLHTLPKPQLITITDVKNVKNNLEHKLNYKYITAMGLLRVGRDTMSQDHISKVQSKVNNLLRV